MEENQVESTEKAQEQGSSPFKESSSSGNGVSFPTVNEPKKSGGAKMLLIVGILVLVGILGFVVYKSATKKSEVASTEPTPFDNLTTGSSQGQTLGAATPAATAKPVDKSAIQIQVQNGTGIAGEAAYLQTQLKGLGYTNVKVGNASDQSGTDTVVTFSSSLNQSVVAELTQELNSLYQIVDTKTSSSQTFDVVIVTGLRKGATPKPSATPVSTPVATPTPTATPQ